MPPHMTIIIVESLQAIESLQFGVFPVEVPDTVNQKQDILTQPCPTPDPQSFEHSNMIVLQDQGVQ